MPAMPATATTTHGTGPSVVASVAISSPPPTPPAVPSTVIPPDVPAGPGAPVVPSRGATGENAPISVAQVSAVAAARAPANAGQPPANAAAAAAPPFARTWRAVRRPPGPPDHCVRRLPERKNAERRRRPDHSDPAAALPATTHAPARPSAVSHFTRRTARAGSGASARVARPARGSWPGRT